MIARLFSVTFASILIAACGNDKECVPSSLKDNIKGTWNAELVSEHSGPQEIVFESNGNYKEGKGLLFGTYFKSEDNWRVENDSLFVEGSLSNGTKVKYGFNLISQTCNEIIFDLEGVDEMKLIRK
ncbi:hypothetical protein [Dyadobacter sp. BHUBP1]|uniref:hypothetical protein n=1 Tax=Dyadobacter sp. BHUBP1 TaxID=3424178 RepID=UPI003D348463